MELISCHGRLVETLQIIRLAEAPIFRQRAVNSSIPPHHFLSHSRIEIGKSSLFR
jgi:hypothetical protein